MTADDDVPLKRIENALQDDGVWVSPDLRSSVSRADEDRIEHAVDDAKEDVYVALVEVPYDDPMLHGDVEAMFTIVSNDTGIQGTFLGLENYEKPAVTATSIGGDDDAMYAAWAAEARHPDDLTDQVVDTIGLIENGTALEVYNRLEESGSVPGGTQSSDDSGLGVGLVAGLVVAAVVVAIGIGLLVRKQRRAKDGFALPTNVMSTIRAAEEQRLHKRANDDVLHLGERIDDAPMSGASHAWQAALDHYGQARRILDRSSAPADIVGAIVLAERGASALDAALDGDEWTAVTPCYFNPLHGAAVRTAQWGGDNGVDVPACAACADSLDGGRTPDDILDFVSEGVPQHYFSLDLPPWSDTGYGSLDADLLGRLRES
ncbi:hypothetical protein [Solicola gregarius]|uniref:Uncharacterized protein n=1 Tax=Solicola gregarius TaxID=2908642 RepID=A0AA46YJV9_9ACTN|nr:hypothetical protein [Solicola gregarius]UYM03989.1 hypothetical protein L0C25_15720 [Solicola gregarius]